MKNIVMVVPCYNESEVIEIFTEKMKQIMDEVMKKWYMDLLVLFVNDGSRDDTLEKMKKISEKDKRFGYLTFTRNFGKEAALLAGLEKAYSMRLEIRGGYAEYIGVMDVDMQDPPNMICDMVSILCEKNPPDCVAVRRTTRKGEPPIRSLFAKTFYKIMNRISDTDMKDGARDFRIMSREMTKSILQVKDKNRFSKGIFGYVGYNIHWLDYENVERAAGKTKWSFYKLMLYALDGITAFTEFPLRTMSLFCGVYGMSQMMLYLAQVINSIVNKNISIWVIAGSDYFMRGVLFIMLAVMGLYQTKIVQEAKDRPLYLIEDEKMPKELYW